MGSSQRLKCDQQSLKLELAFIMD